MATKETKKSNTANLLVTGFAVGASLFASGCGTRSSTEREINSETDSTMLEAEKHARAEVDIIRSVALDESKRIFALRDSANKDLNDLDGSDSLNYGIRARWIKQGFDIDIKNIMREGNKDLIRRLNEEVSGPKKLEGPGGSTHLQ